MWQLKHSVKSKDKSDMAPANSFWTVWVFFQAHNLKVLRTGISLNFLSTFFYWKGCERLRSTFTNTLRVFDGSNPPCCVLITSGIGCFIVKALDRLPMNIMAPHSSLSYDALNWAVLWWLQKTDRSLLCSAPCWPNHSHFVQTVLISLMGFKWHDMLVNQTQVSAGTSECLFLSTIYNGSKGLV